MSGIIPIIVSCRNVRYLVVYGLLLWLIHKNKRVVISVSIASLCRPEVINRIVAVSKMTTTMLGAGHKNVTIFHETTGHTSCCLIIGLCCLVLMRSCCHAVIRSCSNTAEDYATHAPSFLIILSLLRMLYNGQM